MLDSRTSFSIENSVETDSSSKNGEFPESFTQKRKYQLITDDTRKKVIEKIEKGRMTIKQASIECCIKLSTCKAIYNIYQKEGRSEKKKQRIRKVSKKQELQQEKKTSNIVNGLIKSEKNKRKSFYVNFNLVKKSIRKNPSNTTANMAYLEGINPGKLSRNLEMKINSFLKNENCAAMLEQDQNNSLENHSNLLPYPLEHMWKEIFSYFSNVC